MAQYINSGVTSSLTAWVAAASDDGVQLLTRRWDPVNGKSYIKVKASAASYSIATQLMCAFEATSSIGIVKEMSATAELKRPAGVSLGANGAASYYGYLQDGGPANVNMVASAAITVGDPLVASLSQAGSLIPWVANTDVSLVSPILGYALTAVTASVSGAGLVNLILDGNPGGIPLKD